MDIRFISAGVLREGLADRRALHCFGKVLPDFHDAPSYVAVHAIADILLVILRHGMQGGGGCAFHAWLRAASGLQWWWLPLFLFPTVHLLQQQWHQPPTFDVEVAGAAGLVPQRLHIQNGMFVEFLLVLPIDEPQQLQQPHQLYVLQLVGVGGYFVQRPLQCPTVPLLLLIH